MNPVIDKIYTGVVQFSLVSLTIALAWFAFIYYPRVVNDYRTGNFPKKLAVAPVSAASKQFPIETNAYRIVFGKSSDTYYVFINGNNLDAYVNNRNSARLALKTALSMDNLCTISVIYVSNALLSVPQRFNSEPC
ncbi:hypothetical protein HYU92_06295 [Candidatus Curtissbacteria bacterium]|nr:hypothetical protein [Candidatus Curtissbacteria bacterium]